MARPKLDVNSLFYYEFVKTHKIILNHESTFMPKHEKESPKENKKNKFQTLGTASCVSRSKIKKKTNSEDWYRKVDEECAK